MLGEPNKPKNEPTNEPNEKAPSKGQGIASIISTIFQSPILRIVFFVGVLIIMVMVIIVLMGVFDSGEPEVTLRTQVLPDVKTILTQINDDRQAVVTLRLGVLYKDIHSELVEEFRFKGKEIVSKILPAIKNRSIYDILNYEVREQIFSEVVRYIKETVSFPEAILTVYLDDFIVNRTGRGN